jgi:hypothetical protein
MLLTRSSLIRLSAGLAVAALLTTGVVANAATRNRTDPDPGGDPVPATPPTVAPDPADAPFPNPGTELPPSSSTPTTPTTPTTQPRRAGTTTTLRREARPASGQQAVTAFTAAVDRGDAAAAWRLLAPRSQAFWRIQTRFAASFDKLAQGGYGGWTATPDRTARSVVVGASGDGEILIVTLRGSTTLDGRPAVRAHAFPVRHVKRTFLLELWDFGGGDTVPEVFAPGPVFNATIRTTDRTPTFQARVKGEEVAWALDARDATFTNVSGAVAGYQPEEALTPGIHVLTVSSAGPGWLTAAAVIVDVS